MAALFLLSIPLSFAEDSVDDEEPNTEGSFVDSAHASITRRVVATATRLDNFFGDDSVTEEQQNSSSLRLRPTLDWEEQLSTDLDAPLRAYLSLPQTEQRWQAFVATDSDEELNSDFATNSPPAISETGSDNDRRSELGISYIDTSKESRDLRYSLGARTQSFEVDPYLQVRARNSNEFGRWQGRLISKAYYFWEAGGEVSLLADLDRQIGDDGLIRFSSSIEWREQETGLKLRQAVSYRTLLGEKSAAAVGYQVTARTEPSFVPEAHILFVEYRRQIWRDWLFVQVSPQLRYRDEFDYHPHAALILSLDIHFIEDKISNEQASR